MIQILTSAAGQNVGGQGQPLTETAFILAFGMLLLAPLAIAGLALVNTGLGRARSAAQSLLGSLVIVSAAVLTYTAVGTVWPSPLGHGIHSFFLASFASADSRAQLEVLYEIFTVGLAVIIPWGAGSDRLRLIAGIVLAALIAGVPFPLLSNAGWGGGWLAALGTSYGLGSGLMDAGGAASVHVLGGLSALAIVWLTGARKGKFPKLGVATALPGHHAVFVLFGCLLALVGWLGTNCAGSLLWLKLPPAALPIVVLNTILMAVSAALATFTVTQIRFGKPDASLCANSWLTGLVASCAGAGILTPVEALFTGIVAGIATPLLVELLELALSIDDPTGAIPVHAIGGVWGLIVVGVFSHQTGQLLAQLVAVSTLAGLVFPILYLLLWGMDRIAPLRVDADGERLGMDMRELGGSAYPEFVLHRDDSSR